MLSTLTYVSSSWSGIAGAYTDSEPIRLHWRSSKHRSQHEIWSPSWASCWALNCRLVTQEKRGEMCSRQVLKYHLEWSQMRLYLLSWRTTHEPHCGIPHNPISLYGAIHFMFYTIKTKMTRCSHNSWSPPSLLTGWWKQQLLSDQPFWVSTWRAIS